MYLSNSVCLPNLSNLSTYLPTYLTCLIYLSIYLSVYLSIYLSIDRSIDLSIYLSLSVCLSICLSASLKTKLFCETSSFFEVDNIKNEVRTWCVFNILTSKCASRHNGVHFFDISTSKSGPELVCFGHFDLEMCFAPQQRAIFHLFSGQLAPHPPL